MGFVQVNPADLRRMSAILDEVQGDYGVLARRLHSGMPAMPPWADARVHAEIDHASWTLSRKGHDLPPVRDDLNRRAAWAELLGTFGLSLGGAKSSRKRFPLRGLIDHWRHLRVQWPHGGSRGAPVSRPAPQRIGLGDSMNLQGSSPSLQGSSTAIQGSSTAPRATPPKQATPPKSFEVGGRFPIKNSSIAETALTHVPGGTSASPAASAKDAAEGAADFGQCREFVGWVLAGTAGLGGTHAYVYTADNKDHDYYAPFQKLGAATVPSAASAVAGDIVQIGETEADPHLHTFVVVQNDPKHGRFAVVDSNAEGSASNPENHVRYYWRPYPAGDFKIFRLGQP